jgi:hypothetical protein
LQQAAKACDEQDRERQVHREPQPVPEQLDDISLSYREQGADLRCRADSGWRPARLAQADLASPDGPL